MDSLCNGEQVVFADDNQIQIRGLDILELNFTSVSHATLGLNFKQIYN